MSSRRGVSKMTPGIHQELLKKMKEIEQKLAKKSSILKDEIEAAHLELSKKMKEIEHENSKRSSILEGEIEAIGIAKEILEESLSDLREEMEKKVLQTLNKSTRNSKALDSDRQSGRSRELRIEYLERELSKSKDLSANILKGLADLDVVERVDINSKAIRSLKQLVIENQSQLKTSCEKSYHESPVRREYDEWHAFWRNLNAEGATMRGTLDEHIGLIGTNQDLAMKLIKAVRGSHSIHVKGQSDANLDESRPYGRQVRSQGSSLPEEEGKRGPQCNLRTIHESRSRSRQVRSQGSSLPEGEGKRGQ